LVIPPFLIQKWSFLIIFVTYLYHNSLLITTILKMKAVKVTLRTRPKGEHHLSLYFDYYPPIYNQQNKLTRRESLGIYIFKDPKTKEQKTHNKSVMEAAENLRSNRQIQLIRMGVGIEEHLNPKWESSFTHLFNKLIIEGKRKSYSNHHCTRNQLIKFAGDDIKCSQITPKFCNDFKTFLVTGINKKGEKVSNLSVNSAAAYLQVFRNVLFYAFKNDYLKEDVRIKMEGIKTNPTQRQRLTLDEVKKLENTFLKNELKNACMFSIYTGLRFSDIKNLTWGNVVKEEGTTFLRFKYQKTQEFDDLPIQDSSVRFMGERKSDSDKVFPKINYNHQLNSIIKEWVQRAGIKKKITFHCFRHSFATIALNNNIPIEVVSDLLGHRDISTTQIYAKIIGENKRNAVKSLNFGNNTKSNDTSTTG
jgi:integrase